MTQTCVSATRISPLNSKIPLDFTHGWYGPPLSCPCNAHECQDSSHPAKPLHPEGLFYRSSTSSWYLLGFLSLTSSRCFSQDITSSNIIRCYSNVLWELKLLSQDVWGVSDVVCACAQVFSSALTNQIVFFEEWRCLLVLLAEAKLSATAFRNWSQHHQWWPSARVFGHLLRCFKEPVLLCDVCQVVLHPPISHPISHLSSTLV